MRENIAPFFRTLHSTIARQVNKLWGRENHVFGERYRAEPCFDDAIETQSVGIPGHEPGKRGNGEVPLGDGDVLVGFESGFLKVVGEPARINLPAVGTAVLQGRPCAELVGTDGHPHGLWAPVSGTVTAVNEAARADPRWIKNDPHGDGWILRVTPDRLEEELQSLSRV